MTYNPKEYWQHRDNPSPRLLYKFVKDYISGHIKDAETILDYGTGNGRMYELYEGKSVYGMDIVDSHLNECLNKALSLNMDYTFFFGTFDSLDRTFDVAVASKVLLHVLPENIEQRLNQLSQVAGKVVVYDMQSESTAPHVFSHDFSNYVDMQDVKSNGKDLLFWYED